MFAKKCTECGKSFIAKDKRQKVCSDECRIHRKRAIEKEYYKNYIAPKKETHKTCKMCGEKFDAISNTQKYCSEECRKAYHKQPLGRRTFVCAFCGNSFEADARRKYCSAECRRNAELSARKRSKRKKPKLTLSQAAKLSREEGLTYGKYFEKHGYGDM